MNHHREHADSAKPRKRIRDGAVGLLLLFGGIALVAFFIAFPWFGDLDQRWTNCEVIEARPFKGDNTSLQPWHVKIETSDCRDVLYSEGVTEENAQEIADSMMPGSYELKMSWLSRRLAEGWIPTMAPSAEEYRYIN